MVTILTTPPPAPSADNYQAALSPLRLPHPAFFPSVKNPKTSLLKCLNYFYCKAKWTSLLSTINFFCSPLLCSAKLCRSSGWLHHQTLFSHSLWMARTQQCLNMGQEMGLSPASVPFPFCPPFTIVSDIFLLADPEDAGGRGQPVPFSYFSNIFMSF